MIEGRGKQVAINYYVAKISEVTTQAVRALALREKVPGLNHLDTQSSRELLGKCERSMVMSEQDKLWLSSLERTRCKRV